MIEQGDERIFHTANSSFKAFGHSITLIVAGMEFDSVVYFAADPAFQRNLLGRNGCFNRVRFGVIDYYGKLYLSLIDEED